MGDHNIIIIPSFSFSITKFSETILHKFYLYSTKYGIYKPKCGLDNVLMSWGHDEYLYQVLKHNKTTLPDEGLYMIRYHSFYPWHQSGDYTSFENEKDVEMKEWVKLFK